ncbi:MAG: DEAD/DEAH box helicase [Gammaproteobacteria bacterium]|nr:DEAD/DEAH box helicase [Gammaproteobacteria bacterium]MDX2486361.1 DEAD/DEAH box helicase [Gammaproteobacteria bacterium]
MSESEQPSDFNSLGLSSALVKAINHIGYETPSPIQEQCIPYLLDGHDIIGQAQTGTGKTAAFALPLLDLIDVKKNHPQMLVLAPTRELAIQVAEAIQSYAHFMKGFHVLPIYGGQAYNLQLRPLQRGVHVVVGTPGRVMDHIKRGTLKLAGLRALVLDEADEMLRMGFIDDVEWVMTKIPEERQIALFSATMPDVIRRVAEKFLRKPKIIKVKTKTTTAPTIRQRYWQVAGHHKLDALTRILEVEPFEAMLIFVRTKTATLELAEKLSARGFSASAINGDIAQKTREQMIKQLKNGKIDILIATDVAARGLDVDRISHVINYDIPYDPESYVHRIGRTGRAGRSGEAILFVAPREKRMLKSIERVTRQAIEPMKFPTADAVNELRINAFKQKISDALTNQDLKIFSKLITEYHNETGTDPLDIAAALAQIAQGNVPLLVSEQKMQPEKGSERKSERKPDRQRPDRQSSGRETRAQRKDRPDDRARPLSTRPRALKDFPDVEMCRYRVEVGHDDDVKPGNLVGAIANEAEIESCYIGAIDIFDDFSTVDLPAGMPAETFRILKNARVCGKKINISELKSTESGNSKRKSAAKKKSAKSKPSSAGQKRKSSANKMSKQPDKHPSKKRKDQAESK